MDDVTRAKLQLRIVLVTYRQQIVNHPGDGDAAAAFRERARHLLDSVEHDCGGEAEVARLLAEVRRELDGDPETAL
jgi:hypothetical protein